MSIPANESASGDVADAEDSADAETSDQAFGLEYQLRDFLAQNISSIDVDGRRLRVYVDPTGRDGIEFPTAVGPIDVLAIDASGDFYVFEVKRGRSPDHAIGQLARYMGWVKQTIGRDKRVSGVIVAKQIVANLRYAVSVMPNVTLFEYQVEFHLKAVGSDQHG
jgi:RecB family endonuclease NucS